MNTDHWPPGRTAHAMAYDSNRGQVVLLGGGTGGANGYRADTWEYGVFTQAMTAGFSASPLTGTAPLTVTFTDQSGGAVDSLRWDYGDGSTSLTTGGATSTTSALTHTHTYTQPGTYTVTLAVSGLGGSDTLTRTDYITVTSPVISRVISYTYDHLYRLTGADYSSGESFAYGYDPVGNRTVQTRTLTSTSVITYVYDAANRLDYFYEDGVLIELDWDANGNLLTQGTSVYTWDAANRLVAAEVDGVVSAYEYDGLGNRVAQTVSGVTTEYVLDVGGGLPEVIVATTSGASTRYVQAQGQGLAQQDSGAWTYILPDHLGSVRQLVDAAGQVALAQSFDPFGVPFEASGSGESDFGYTGEWWDAEAELLYLRARYYNRAVGRFISQDPWPGTATHPKTLHSYMYAASNPIIYTDASGLDYIREVDRYTCDDPNALGGYVLHLDKATGLVDWWPCIVDPANVQMNPNPYRDGTEVPIPPNAPGYPEPKRDGPRRSHGWGPINSCSPLAPDDVSWRYRPECWAPLPTVLETWEQVEASYVNTPFSGEDGYAVGGSLTAQGPWSGCVPNAMVSGTEIVYDFFHQQRGSFSYSGRGSRFATSLLAVGVTGYVGYLEGFSRWPNEVGVRAYRGVSLSLAGSYDAFSATPVGLPEAVSAGLSAGGIFAASYDLPTGRFNPQGIRGIYFGASAGGGVGVPGVYAPVSAETYLTEYELKGAPKVYSGGVGDNKVNRLLGAVKMIVDMRVHGWGNGKADSLALQWAIRGAR